MKIAVAAARGNPSSATSGPRRTMLETVRRIRRVENGGRTNRCR
jgi:hypothetical protein